MELDFQSYVKRLRINHKNSESEPIEYQKVLAKKVE